MIRITIPRLSEIEPCPYLNGCQARFEYFFARSVTARELDMLLSAGWRKFGMYFFRPACPDCSRCIPLRVPVRRFTFSKSQRRTARRCEHIAFSWSEPSFRDEIYSLYCEHSESRFQKKCTFENFWYSFYHLPGPALQTEYRVGDTLAGVGFLDRTATALNSVYFAFASSFARYRPGVFSVLREIQLAVSLGLRYYYLGYYVADNHRMSYKADFRPNERMSWESGVWRSHD